MKPMAVNPALQALLVPVADLKEDPSNVRTHGERNMDAIMASLEQFGQQKPIVVAPDGRVVAGNATLRAAKLLGWESIAAVMFDQEGKVMETAYAIADNRTAELAEWDEASLAATLMSLQEDGLDWDLAFSDEEIAKMLAEPEVPGPTLEEQFLVPPFSVLDGRQGYWQEQKRAWLMLGIRSELGRSEGVWATLGEYNRGEDTSVFDPVLCELAYRWFSPPGGSVLDPFAGGSVRGIVAAALGRQYVGVDLSKPQVEANREQWREVAPRLDTEYALDPEWLAGDSRKRLPKTEVDLVFTCPPYYNLEQYSEDPRDLSNAPTYNDFLEGYGDVMTKAAGRLKEDRFAVVVVSQIRDEGGMYHDLVGDTVRLMSYAGAALYNEAVFISPIGSLAQRAAGPFKATRKLGRGHQNVLVFLKGDAKVATKACGPVEVQTGTQEEEVA